jgi:hypothetical protein
MESKKSEKVFPNIFKILTPPLEKRSSIIHKFTDGMGHMTKR